MGVPDLYQGWTAFQEPCAADAVTSKECLFREVVGVMSGIERVQVGASGSTVSVEEAARLLGIGRTLAYRLAAAGELPVPVVRIGRKLRIPAAPLRALLGLGADA